MNLYFGKPFPAFPSTNQESTMDVNSFVDAVVNGENWNGEPDTDAMVVPARDVRDAYIEQTEKQLEEAAAEATELHDTVTNLNTRINNQRDSFYQLQRDFDKFKKDVRTVIVESHDEGDFNERTATEMLDTLGLDGLKRNYTVQVTLSHTVEIEVEATSEYDAQEKVDGMDVDEILEQSGACIDYFDINVDNAWEA